MSNRAARRRADKEAKRKDKKHTQQTKPVVRKGPLVTEVHIYRDEGKVEMKYLTTKGEERSIEHIDHLATQTQLDGAAYALMQQGIITDDEDEE